VPIVLAAALLLFAEPTPATKCATDPCPSGAKSCAVERAYWNFECKHYSAAAEAFTDLYTSDPRAEFLFNAANARRLSGDCWTALALYKRFLDLGPPPDWVELAQHNVQRCQEQIAAGREQAARVGPPPPRVQPQDAPPPDPPQPPAKKEWPRDPAGGALVGVGAVLTAVGIGLVAGGAWKLERAEHALTDTEFGRRHRSGLALQRAGIPVLSVGVALAVAGAIRWGVLARRETRASAARTR
jgi:hypothetical protein